MICADCSHQGPVTPDDRCSSCGRSALLAGRYRLEDVLSRGQDGSTTYRAERATDGARVAVTELLLSRVVAHEDIERFQREVDALRTLRHPGIVGYVEHFEAPPEARERGLYRVEELIDGVTLATEMASRRYTEPEVIALLIELLGVLHYLHMLRPPVVHRDLKPSNIMRRADGRLVLIDLGAAGEAVYQAGLDVTSAGTFGYMAPEQHAGLATPQSDLYGVGALALALLGRCPPQELLDGENRLAWRGRVHMSAPLGQLIDSLVAREPAMRPAAARAAADRLYGIATGAKAPGAAEIAPLPPPNAGRAVNLPWRQLSPTTAFPMLFGAIFGGVGLGVGVVLSLVGWLVGLPFAAIGGGIGAAFAVVGGGVFLIGLGRARGERRLRELGHQVQGRIQQLKPDHRFRIKRRHPFVFGYRFDVDQKTYESRGHVWDPEAAGLRDLGPVTILYDPKDPTKSLPWLPGQGAV